MPRQAIRLSREDVRTEREEKRRDAVRATASSQTEDYRELQSRAREAGITPLNQSAEKLRQALGDQK